MLLNSDLYVCPLQVKPKLVKCTVDLEFIWDTLFPAGTLQRIPCDEDVDVFLWPGTEWRLVKHFKKVEETLVLEVEFQRCSASANPANVLHMMRALKARLAADESARRGVSLAYIDESELTAKNRRKVVRKRAKEVPDSSSSDSADSDVSDTEAKVEPRGLPDGLEFEVDPSSGIFKFDPKWESGEYLPNTPVTPKSPDGLALIKFEYSTEDEDCDEEEGEISIDEGEASDSVESNTEPVSRRESSGSDDPDALGTPIEVQEMFQTIDFCSNALEELYEALKSISHAKDEDCMETTESKS